jgi:predicted acyl esterase
MHIVKETCYDWLGSSHGAMVQTVMALHRPPHLTAMWPDVGPTRIYAHEAREGGAMER